MAASNHKTGSYTQPDRITLTLSRQELTNLLAEKDWQVTYKNFKLRAGIRLDIVVQTEPRTD